MDICIFLLPPLPPSNLSYLYVLVILSWWPCFLGHWGSEQGFSSSYHPITSSIHTCSLIPHPPGLCRHQRPCPLMLTQDCRLLSSARPLPELRSFREQEVTVTFPHAGTQGMCLKCAHMLIKHVLKLHSPVINLLIWSFRVYSNYYNLGLHDWSRRETQHLALLEVKVTLYLPQGGFPPSIAQLICTFLTVYKWQMCWAAFYLKPSIELIPELKNI